MFKVINDWENLTYKFNGKEIDPKAITRVGFLIGDKTRIFKTHCERGYASYSDHGHVYGTHRDELYMNVPLIDLSGVEVRVPLFNEEMLWEYIKLVEFDLGNGKTDIMKAN